MAVRAIDGNALIEWFRPYLHTGEPIPADVVIEDIRSMPTLTQPNASSDLISRSALLRGETEPEIITGSDSEIAEQFEWRRWVDKIKRAPAVDKEE